MSQGNAPLGPVTLTSPGFFGLNTQLASTTLPAEWATNIKNAIFDSSNRLASRLGWAAISSSPISGTPEATRMFEYIPFTGSTVVVQATANNKLYIGTTTYTDKTGAIVPTANRWKFVNYNGNCYGLQSGHPLIQYTGTGSFTATAAASGTVPAGDALLSAFGRLWASDANGQKVKYCGLLDATNWGGAGAGTIDLTNVWPTGQDSIVAIESFNNFLVVFGSSNIIIYEDGTGSVLGLNPTNIVVRDVVAKVGAVSRDTVINVNGDDLVFLSQHGLQSFQRSVIEKSNPKHELSVNIRDYLLGYLAQETLNNVQAVYNPFYAIYVLLLPSTSKIFVFDAKFEIPQNQDPRLATTAGAWRALEWDNYIPPCLLVLQDGRTMYTGRAGRIVAYTNTYTDDGASYNFRYETGWLEVDPEIKDRLKFLKRIAGLLFMQGTQTVTVQWAFDFDETFRTATVSAGSMTAGGEWGTGEWGTAEWGAGSSLTPFLTPASGQGQYIKVAVQVPVSGNLFALQQLQIFAKIGRIR